MSTIIGLICPPAGRTASTHEDHDGPVHRPSSLDPIKMTYEAAKKRGGTLDKIVGSYQRCAKIQ